MKWHHIAMRAALVLGTLVSAILASGAPEKW